MKNWTVRQRIIWSFGAVIAQLGEAARQIAESLRQFISVIEQLNIASQGTKTGVERFKLL